MLRIGLRYAAPMEFIDVLEKSSPEKKDKLEYFRKLILNHLSRLEKADRDRFKKSILIAESLVKGGFPVGTIRIWNGQKNVKIAPGEWRTKYDSQSRGAKMAISAIKKRIAAARDEHEMMKIVLEHHDRFIDHQGHPLPFVQELHAYIEGQKTVKQPSSRGKSKEPSKTASKNNEEKQTPKEQGKTGKENINEQVGSKQEGTEDKKIVRQSEQLEFDYNRINRLDEKELADAIDNAGTLKNICIKRSKAYREAGNNDYAKNFDGIVKEAERVGLALTKRQAEILVAIESSKTEKQNTETGNRETGKKHDTTASKDGNDGKSSGNKWIDKLAAMSYEEFDKLPDKDKTAYNLWVRKERDRLVNHYERMEDKKDTEGTLTQKLQEFAKRYGKEPSHTEKSDFEKIQEKYQSAASVTGDEDEIQAGKEVLSGVWKLVEADTPSASHDENTFHKTPGFPAGKDGSTINDRDYGHDKAAQEAVMNIAADYDGRALKFDSPIVVTKDGIVISGNNRTMSSKIAARKGTDTKYIEALKKRAKKFGFTGEQVSQFKNPRVVFEVENDGGYSTEQFAKFNQSGKKEMGPTEKAVKVSKLIKSETVEAIAKTIGEFDTLGELYADRNAVQHIFAVFKDAGLIGENEIAKYIEEGSVTDDGKTFIETAMLGSVMNESNIRGFNRTGCKSIRATLVRAITPLIENKGLTGYSINKELNEAVDIAMQVAVEKDKFKSVDEFSKQGSMFDTLDPVAVELAKKLEGTQKAFAEFMQKLNGGLKYASNGEADIFLGGVESKDDIINRFFNIKKAVSEVLNGIRNLFR